MITPLSLDLVEYIVDQSGSVDILADGLQRDHRGRPFNKQLLRTLLIGWLLTNQEQGTMRIKTASATAPAPTHTSKTPNGPDANE